MLLPEQYSVRIPAGAEGQASVVARVPAMEKDVARAAKRAAKTPLTAPRAALRARLAAASVVTPYASSILGSTTAGSQAVSSENGFTASTGSRWT